MRRSLSCLVLVLACSCNHAQADEIKFKSGQTVTGQVTGFKAGVITIKKPDGTTISGDIGKVEQIDFTPEAVAEPPSPVAKAQAKAPPLSKAVRDEIQKSIEQAKATLQKAGTPQAIVSVYIDTETPGDTLPQGDVEYRCYTGGGYSGIMRVPLRKAWTRLEYLRAGPGTKRIQLDPGPPYETYSQEVSLEEGKVVELGRVVLKKVKASGAANISGVVKDTAGNPLPGVEVTAGKKKTKSNSNGNYKLEGFGLEIVDLKAAKNGYFGGTARLPIRDMENRAIEQDLILHRPHHVKLRYVVSPRQSDDVSGDGVEEGTISATVDAVHFPLVKLPNLSPAIAEFVNDSRLELDLSSGQLRLRNTIAPIYYEQAPPNADFASIKEVGAIASSKQQCPPLKANSIILIRGFPQGSTRGISNYCLKVLVEEQTAE